MKELEKKTNLWRFNDDSMFGTQIDVDDALAFVGRTHGQVFVAILVDVSQVSQRPSEPVNEGDDSFSSDDPSQFSIIGHDVT